MSLTKKNHINPCFWTAIWNKDYYDKFKADNHINIPSRDQLLYFLESRSNKTLVDKAENIHYEKGLGLAEIKPEKAKEFCKRHFPEKYDSFIKEMQSHPETLWLDFENHFSIIETLPSYSVLLKTIQTHKVLTTEDKTWLTLFLLNHRLRSHVFINAMTEFYKKLGIEKFELFWLLKWSLADPRFLILETSKILQSHWTIYTTKNKIFPLSDNPINRNKQTIIATLAPDMVLFVNLKKDGEPNKVIFKKGISWLKYRTYKRLTISNTIKGLIFYDKVTLEKWKSSKWWTQRREFLSKNKEYNKLIVKDGLKELWEIDSITNRLM